MLCAELQIFRNFPRLLRIGIRPGCVTHRWKFPALRIYCSTWESDRNAQREISIVLIDYFPFAVTLFPRETLFRFVENNERLSVSPQGRAPRQTTAYMCLKGAKSEMFPNRLTDTIPSAGLSKGRRTTSVFYREDNPLRVLLS